MTPSPLEIEDLFKDLRAVKLADLEHRLREAIRRDASGSVLPDGFPPQSGGGFSTDISRPTENAVIGTYKPARRSEPDGPHVQVLPKDPVHEDAVNAWGFAQDALWAFKAAIARLDHLENLTGKPRDPELCNSCLQVGVKTPMEHYGDVAGKLARPWRLCAPCYDWIRRHAGGPPSKAYLENRHGVGMKGKKRVDPTRKVS